MKKGKKYDSTLPREMYLFFTDSISDSLPPSFSKFARKIGVTLEELEGYRKRKTFDKSWRDCLEIRRDYLIDCALTRRYDPSFVKFLLSSEGAEGEFGEDTSLSVSIKVEE